MDSNKLPDGRYKARALDMQLGLTAANKEQVGVEFEITDPDHAGIRLTWYGYFTDKTAERTLQSLRFCGWKSDDLTDSTGISDNEVELVIEAEEYNGQKRPKIQWVNKLGGIGMKSPMNEAQRKAFAQRMKGAAVKSRQAAPAEKPLDPKDAPPF